LVRSMRTIPVAARLIAAFVAASLAGLSGAGQASAMAQDAAPTTAPGGVLWTSVYSATTGGAGSAIASSPSGKTVFAAGFVPIGDPSGFATAFATVAYNAETGSQLWASLYHGAGDTSRATAVAASPDGSKVFVTGSSEGNGTNRDSATVAYNSTTGQQLWVRRYNGPVNTGDDPAAIVVDPDSKTVFVTGTSQGVRVGVDYTTIAYDAATGKQLWLSRYNNPRRNGLDSASALAISPDGSRLYVTGTSHGRSSQLDYATVAYAAASGKQEWVARYNGHANQDDFARSVAVSPDGSKVFVTGSSWGTSLYDYATIAYQAATGDPLWTRRYVEPSQDIAVAVVANPRRNAVYVTGSSYGGATHRDIATVAYKATTGAPLWISRFDGNHKGDVPASLAVSPNGVSVVIAGYSAAGTTNTQSYRFLVLAYGAAGGTKLWSTRLLQNAGANDNAAGVVVSPNNSTVFATGHKNGMMTTVAIRQ
jgi:DNA-binding beta-propeller fold protein YncE